MKFINLRCRSEFSMLASTCKIDDLLITAVKHKIPALGLCDTGNTFGSLVFSGSLKKKGVKPIIGCLIKLKTCGVVSELPLFAKNQEGYQNILKLTFYANFADEEDSGTITREQLLQNSAGIILLTGDSRNGIFAKIEDSKTLSDLLTDLNKTFANDLFLEIARLGYKNEKKIEERILAASHNFSLPLVATNEVRFIEKKDYRAYDIVTCIAAARYEVEQDRTRDSIHHYFKSQKEIEEIFSDIPSAIENSLVIAKKCNFLVDSLGYMLPNYPLPEGKSEKEYLEETSKAGLEERLQNLSISTQREEYFKRLDYELDVISKMGFSGYFLIVADFIAWAKNNGIPVGPGRGSGAGSMVAWALKITNLDPIHYQLLFERFLNPDRVSMPDFDIDFCQDRRGEVIEYVKEKYGEDKVGAIITFGKLQAKAVLKDVGRVLQVNYGQIDAICKMIPFSPLEPITLEKAISLDPKLKEQKEGDPEIGEMIDIALQLEGLNRHSSTHAAGVVISNKPLVEITTLCKDDKTDMPIIGFNMKDVEKIGLIKFDFLGLKTLTVLAETVKLVKQNRGDIIDIDSIPIDDIKTFEFLRSGKLKGIFQLEAALPRETLTRINTDRIEDLIAITSLNRPGPMDNIPSYIRRKNGQEAITYPHPLLEEVLKETYGIIIYQEQVMQIAQKLARYTLGGADLLRRAMGKKIQSEMDEQRQIFVNGAKNNGVDEKKASEIFDIVDKFAGYGFNKSHAAAYSVISYQTAYLKAHYLIEFIVANLNLEIDNTDKINEFINDSRTLGLEIVPPDINISEAMFSIKDNKIIYGLGAIKGVGIEASKQLIEIRNTAGNFENIFDFAEKCGSRICNKKQLESLVKVGGFDKIIDSRKQILENVELIVKHASVFNETDNSNQDNLFGDVKSLISRPNLAKCTEYSEEELMNLEFESIGFFLSKHPLLAYADVIGDYTTSNEELNTKLNSGAAKEYACYMSGVISKVKQRFNSKGKRFAFVHMVDLEGVFETSIFDSDIISVNREILQEGQVVACYVNAKRDDETGIRIIVDRMYSIKSFVHSVESKLIPRKAGSGSNTFAASVSSFKTNSSNKVISTSVAPLEKIGKKQNIVISLHNGHEDMQSKFASVLNQLKTKTDIEQKSPPVYLGFAANHGERVLVKTGIYSSLEQIREIASNHDFSAIDIEMLEDMNI